MGTADDERTPERELLAAARAGDDEAFALLYQRHYDSVLTYALTLTNPVRAHDLVSEAIAKVYRLVRAGKGPETAFRAYLCATIQSVNADSLRRVGRELPFDDVGQITEHATPDAADSIVEGDAVIRAFRALPQRWQAVLWGTVVEGRTVQEVGTASDLSANSVSVLAMRAREGLKRAYLSQHIEATPAGRECRSYADDLAKYVRGRLVTSRHAVIEDHVRRCGECARVVEDLDGINKRFAAVLLPVLLLGAVSTAGGRALALPEPAPSAVRVPLRGRLTHLVRQMQVALPGAGPSIAAAAVVATVVAVGAAAISGANHGHAGQQTRSAGQALSEAAGSPAWSVDWDRPQSVRPARASVLPAHEQTSSPSDEPTAAGSQSTPATPTAPSLSVGGHQSPAASPVGTVSTPSVTPAPASQGTKSLEFTQVGTCSMQGAAVDCVDPSGPSAPELVMTPSSGGTCSILNQTVNCAGPLQITDKHAIDPSTGQPTVLYTQTGAADTCQVQQQVMTCYRA